MCDCQQKSYLRYKLRTMYSIHRYISGNKFKENIHFQTANYFRYHKVAFRIRVSHKRHFFSDPFYLLGNYATIYSKLFPEKNRFLYWNLAAGSAYLVLALQSNFYLLKCLYLFLKIAIFTKFVIKWLKLITEQKLR